MRALISLLACVTLPALAAGFNDTGIYLCVDDSSSTAACNPAALDGESYPRQDGRYGRDAAAMVNMLPKVGGGQVGFDFTALDAYGQPTSPGVTPCTRDNVTGLIWEVKTTDGGLRDQKWTYSSYDSVHNYGGSPGYASGGTCKTTGHCDTEKYVADVKASALCGFSDWRMPTWLELQGIAHLGRTNPAIDPTYFPNTPSSNFWSGSPLDGYSGETWVVNFDYGSVAGGSRGYGYHVRLVRSGQ
jgi:hypothetical protein